MKKLVWAFVLIASCGAAPRARAGSQDMAIDHPTGEMHIQLEVPIVSDVDQRTPITAGHIEIAPVEGVDVGLVGPDKRFVLTAANVRFADFTIDRDPFAKLVHQNVGVHLASAVLFTATSTGPGAYAFTIPPQLFLFESASLTNGQIERTDDVPSQPVTGTLDLDHGTFRAHVVVPRHRHIDAGDIDGTLTVDVSGSIVFPDADHDGVRDSRDNCRLGPNPDQRSVVSPTIQAPADIVRSSCTPFPIGDAVAADVCEGRPVTVTNDAPLHFPAGVTSVTWTAEDADRHVATAAQKVTIVDTTPPRFLSVPPPLVRGACGPADLGLPVAVDDCDFGPPVVTNDAPQSFPPGSTKVTWTATDRSGNRTTATQLVTVNDATPPVFTFVPPDVTITTCVGGFFGQAQATDACGVTVTHDAPVQFPLGETTVVTWTARDAVGNTTRATQRVFAELGDDPSCCPAGTNVILGTEGRDILRGTAGRDCLLGRGGDDVLHGFQGDDVLSGGDGDDAVDGGPGDDRLVGGPGRDSCAGASGANVVISCEVGP